MTVTMKPKICTLLEEIFANFFRTFRDNQFSRIKHNQGYHGNYLKGRNFRGKKISRIFFKFVNISSLFDPRKCRFAKINFAQFFKIGVSRKLIPAKFFKNQCNANIAVSVAYFVLYLRRKVS